MNDKKYKIGIFVDNHLPRVDGVTVGVDSLARILKDMVDLTVFTIKPHNMKVDDSVFPYKVVRCKSHAIPFGGNTDYDMPVPLFDRRFRKIVKNADLDLVHVQSPFAVGKVGLGYARKNKVPVVITMHSQFRHDFVKATKSRVLGELALKIVMQVFNACDEVWSVNEASKEVSLDYGIKRPLVTMENGTNMKPVSRVAAANEINKQYNIDPKQKVLIFVGRLVTVKNIFFIAKVLKELKEKKFDFKMMFVGDGAEREKLQKKINEYGLADNVIFTGVVSDREKLANYYARADLFLFPSVYDTDGVVKKEAACQKLPIICLEDTIVAKSIKDGVNAYIGANDPVLFADKIIAALADPKAHKAICGNAFRDLYITWQETAEKTVERYAHLIKQNQSS